MTTLCLARPRARGSTLGACKKDYVNEGSEEDQLREDCTLRKPVVTETELLTRREQLLTSMIRLPLHPSSNNHLLIKKRTKQEE